MDAAEKESQLEQERDQARQDLHDTLAEVGAKLEIAEEQLRPVHLIESHAIGAAIVAGGLGFIFGSTSESRMAGAVISAALFGFALSRRSAPDGEQLDVGIETPDQW
jgi:hypothetical protein